MGPLRVFIMRCKGGEDWVDVSKSMWYRQIAGV